MSKPLTDRQGATEIVASAAETHAVAPPKSSPSCSPTASKAKRRSPMWRWFSGSSPASNGDYSARRHADEAHEKELGDDAEPRDAATATSKLATELAEIRDTLDSTFGQRSSRSWGSTDGSSMDPKAVLARAKRLVTALGSEARMAKAEA